MDRNFGKIWEKEVPIKRYYENTKVRNHLRDLEVQEG
jgi:hypothetical protein